ncbi:hypothetical protein [Bacillus sp. FJAT-52991]|uniref:Uncharacterized protein n=1 Tax=Bacillus kandeliae TaxID=3129297 RepID=A0ABZ2N9Z6_9BACI
MNKDSYVLHLIEDPMFGGDRGAFIGYWTGGRYRGDDVWFPGVADDKYDKNVKVYTSKKRAENAVEKLKDKFTFVTNAVIEKLDAERMTNDQLVVVDWLSSTKGDFLVNLIELEGSYPSVPDDVLDAYERLTVKEILEAIKESANNLLVEMT